MHAGHLRYKATDYSSEGTADYDTVPKMIAHLMEVSKQGQLSQPLITGILRAP